LKNISVLLLIATTVVGCTVIPSRYQIHQDVAPQRLPSANEIKDITPLDIPYSRGGNKDYTVRGISYQVLNSHENYSATGIASWYGAKFHGHLTSNGEIYDMYGLSAAHKSLPIPSFAKVTNLSNGKHTIVRINDRGPFHPHRLIDLSYGAAFKLGVLDNGTANVRIDSIRFERQGMPIKSVEQGCSIQLIALQSEQAARLALQQVQRDFSHPGYLQKSGSVTRVKLGPIDSLIQCEQILKKVLKIYPKAFIKH